MLRCSNDFVPYKRNIVPSEDEGRLVRDPKGGRRTVDSSCDGSSPY